MEDVPQLAVQDLKTTSLKKVEHQHSTHRNNRILHIACHLPHERHTIFNTLNNWGHKTSTQSKRLKDRKEKVKGSWPETHTIHLVTNK